MDTLPESTCLRVSLPGMEVIGRRRSEAGPWTWYMWGQENGEGRGQACSAASLHHCQGDPSIFLDPLLVHPISLQ